MSFLGSFINVSPLVFEVDDYLPNEWDSEYRYGAVEGTFQVPSQAIMRFQKISGTDFITLIQGAVQLKAVADDITEITLVEHLDAFVEETNHLSGYAKDLFDEVVLHTDSQLLPEY